MKGQRFIYTAIMALLVIPGCKMRSDSASDQKSLEFPDGVAHDAGTGYISWECMSRRYANGYVDPDSSVHHDAINAATIDSDWNYQDEYCEFKREGNFCKFTTSMENAGFHLHRENTNSLSAAQTLVEDCVRDATAELKAHGNVGKDCGKAGCVKTRNSDPHICDEVRQLVKNAATSTYRVIDLEARRQDWSALPLMKLGPTAAALPAGCTYDKLTGGADDQRHVTCEMPPDSPAEVTCGSLYGSAVHLGIAVELTRATPAAAVASTSPATAVATTSPGAGLRLDDAAATDAGNIFDTTGLVSVLSFGDGASRTDAVQTTDAPASTAPAAPASSTPVDPSAP